MQVHKEQKYVVINIGSSFITGMLSIKHPGGLIQPLATSRQPSLDNIKRGYIHNIDEAAKIIGLIIDSLSAHLQEDEKISSVYVGLECVSMRSRSFRSHLPLAPEGEIITQEHLLTLRDQAQDASYEKDEIVRILHPRYYVDGKIELKPQGVRAKNIDAVFQIITVRRNILENLRTVFADKLEIDVNEILLTPVAEATTFLSSQEAMLGCAYINIGGGCTSVSLYKDRLLSGLYILPMGGKDVTKDLESLSLLESHAEQIKRSKASMDLDGSRTETLTIDGMSIKQIDVNRTVMARMAEIMLNFTNIVSEANANEQVNISSWIFGGGGALLAGFIESISAQIEQNVRFAEIRPEFVSGAVPEGERKTFASELALTHLASKDCVELIYQPMETLGLEGEEEPESKPETIDQDALPIGGSSSPEPIVSEPITIQTEIQSKPISSTEEKKPAKGSSFLSGLKDWAMEILDTVNDQNQDDDDD